MKVLITGGAGFIGSNLAERLLSAGEKVIIFDNFSRDGVEKNISWLRKNKKSRNLKVIRGDVRNYKNVLKWVKGVDVVFHLAAQVAVTNSVKDPREDFEINAGGTLNVIEAARLQKKMPVVVYSSTNKVYGELKAVKIGNGIKETQPLDFHSPYGCSKGTADQYVRDYARIYGLPTVVFRQSCVYGERQMGMEDQGWIAHFAIRALKNEPITIFGDGKQVRDLLYVDDLIDAYLLAVKNIGKCKGEVFNIGGGIKNAVSLMKAISLVEDKTKRKIKLKFGKVRPGDQKIFISDNSKLKKVLGFHIKTGYSQGLTNLITWLQNQNLQK
jgi:CDP-paratose 2-epimerase